MAICGGVVLEEVLNLSSDRLLDDDDPKCIYIYIYIFYNTFL